MDLFYLSLISAVISILLSLLSEKYWTKERAKAVLINVGCNECSDSEDNLCDCEIIDLTNKYYQAEFGGREKLFDGITVRAVIKGLKPDEIQAKVFLNDNRFVINGNISVISRPRTEFKENKLTKYYDARSEQHYIYPEEDVKLFDYDLVNIKDENNSVVASFVFMLVESIDDKKIYNNRIVVENRKPETTEVAEKC